jgi:hypothetical protein
VIRRERGECERSPHLPVLGLDAELVHCIIAVHVAAGLEGNNVAVRGEYLAGDWAGILTLCGGQGAGSRGYGTAAKAQPCSRRQGNAGTTAQGRQGRHPSVSHLCDILVSTLMMV